MVLMSRARFFAVFAIAGLFDPASAAATAPAVCASDVLHEIDNIIGLANLITQATVDCTLPGLDEASCASDISLATAVASGIAGLAADMTMTCGDLDNLCTASVTGMTMFMSWTAGGLIAAAGDCQEDPWLCVYDVISAVDTINGLAVSIIGVVDACSPQAIEMALKHPKASILKFPNLRYSDLHIYGRRDYGPASKFDYERRLQAVEANHTASSVAAFQSETAGNQTGSDKIAQLRSVAHQLTLMVEQKELQGLEASPPAAPTIPDSNIVMI